MWSRFISPFIFKAFNAFAIIRPREYSETLAWAINPFPAATTRVIALAISQTLALAVTQQPGGGGLAGVHFGQRLNKRMNFKWTLDRPGCPSFIIVYLHFTAAGCSPPYALTTWRGYLTALAGSVITLKRVPCFLNGANDFPITSEKKPWPFCTVFMSHEYCSACMLCKRMLCMFRLARVCLVTTKCECV